MNLDHVFKKTTKGLYHTGINPSVPDDLLCKCKKCGGIVLIDDVRSGGYICPKCGGYFRMSAYERIKRVADEGTFWNGTEILSERIRCSLRGMKQSSQRQGCERT